MTLIATPVADTKIVPQHKLHWRGGPAQLHLQRLRGNYRLPSHLMDQLTKGTVKDWIVARGPTKLIAPWLRGYGCVRCWGK